MSLDDAVHKHFDALEYKTADQVFKTLKPVWHDTLHSYFSQAEHGDSPRKRKEGLEQYKLYLEARKYDIGEPLYSMYCNYYLCLKDRV
mgnify:CR=1 FL=1